MEQILRSLAVCVIAALLMMSTPPPATATAYG